MERSISNRRVTGGKVLLLLCFIEIPVFNTSSVDPAKTQHSAAYDLGLHCLPKSLLWDPTHKLQSTLIISNLLISNNRLYRSEILVPVLTWKSKNR